MLSSLLPSLDTTMLSNTTAAMMSNDQDSQQSAAELLQNLQKQLRDALSTTELLLQSLPLDVVVVAKTTTSNVVAVDEANKKEEESREGTVSVKKGKVKAAEDDNDDLRQTQGFNTSKNFRSFRSSGASSNHSGRSRNSSNQSASRPSHGSFSLKPDVGEEASFMSRNQESITAEFTGEGSSNFFNAGTEATDDNNPHEASCIKFSIRRRTSSRKVTDSEEDEPISSNARFRRSLSNMGDATGGGGSSSSITKSMRMSLSHINKNDSFSGGSAPAGPLTKSLNRSHSMASMSVNSAGNSSGGGSRRYSRKARLPQKSKSLVEGSKKKAAVIALARQATQESLEHVTGRKGIRPAPGHSSSRRYSADHVGRGGGVNNARSGGGTSDVSVMSSIMDTSVADAVGGLMDDASTAASNVLPPSLPTTIRVKSDSSVHTQTTPKASSDQESKKNAQWTASSPQKRAAQVTTTSNRAETPKELRSLRNVLMATQQPSMKDISELGESNVFGDESSSILGEESSSSSSRRGSMRRWNSQKRMNSINNNNNNLSAMILTPMPDDSMADDSSVLISPAVGNDSSRRGSMRRWKSQSRIDTLGAMPDDSMTSQFSESSSMRSTTIRRGPGLLRQLSKSEQFLSQAQQSMSSSTSSTSSSSSKKNSQWTSSNRSSRKREKEQSSSHILPPSLLTAAATSASNSSLLGTGTFQDDDSDCTSILGRRR